MGLIVVVMVLLLERDQVVVVLVMLVIMDIYVNIVKLHFLFNLGNWGGCSTYAFTANNDNGNDFQRSRIVLILASV
jgi:hypothetical protein